MFRAWLSRRIHVSWLLAVGSAAIVIGIGLAALFGAHHVIDYEWALVGVILVGISVARRRRWLIIMIITGGLLVGWWRGGIEQSSAQLYRPYYGKVVSLRGAISEDASFGPGGDQRIFISNVLVDQEPLTGSVWVSTESEQALQRSDTVELEGRLGPGFGSVSASMFRAQVIRTQRPQPGDIGLQLRNWFAAGIQRAIAAPESNLASGYLVGQRTALPADLDAQLKVVGLTHVVVASGYNLTILVGLARRLLLRTSKYLATLSALGMMISFIMISGWSPSMARAGLVTGLSLAAWYYGRKIHPIVLLPVAAAITALINPFYAWGDIGWYLSFASFAGVIILAPILQHSFWRSKKSPNVIVQIVIETMSAQIATLPIMIYAFGYYSPYALLANLLVLPLVPLTMLLTFIAGLVGVIAPEFAPIAGWPATIILRYMIAVVRWVADFPGAQLTITIDGFVLAMSYLLITVIVIIAWRWSRYNFRHDYRDDVI